MLILRIAILQSGQAQHLSDYERKEILDYPSVYCIGAKSKKKPAVPEVPTNNYGYDDERGDYLVVNRDHLAYRYEVIDTLGKGSFGQVLHCRDHSTGESLAIKIIRNKKRFHHQALVEVKILDNLRKWVSYQSGVGIIITLTFLTGCCRETPCHKNDGPLLLSQPPMYRHGAP